MATKATKPSAGTTAAFPLPALAKGEVYAGILLDDAGKPAHHLVLLPGDESLNWKKAGEWAKKQGGELPTRREQSLLFANAKQHFQEAWYWSSETHARDAGFAWNQNFSDGFQTSDHKDDESRCRAVRRAAI